MRKTAVMGVRVDRADWDAFGELCQSLGTNRNAALVAFIKAGASQFLGCGLLPDGPCNAPAVPLDASRSPYQELLQSGCVEVNEPIFKSGVGSRGGKK